MFPTISMRKWVAHKLTSVVALTLWLNSTTAFGQPFVEVASGLPAVFNASVSWGDYDNDGDLDLLIAGDTGTNLLTRIYRNDVGTFVDLNAGLPGISEGAVAWADYNGDGYLDFGLTGGGTAALYSRIYRNNRNGTFTNINAILPPLEGSTLAWSDYDNDGDLDLFLTGYTGSAYVGAVYRNDGNDAFTDSGITTIRGGAAGSAAWSDFDNDGDQDLLFAGFTLDTTSGQSSRLYRNNNGAFTNITSISLTAMSYSSVAWGDYDNDNNLDILMAGSSISGVQSFPTLRLYRNTGAGAFTTISSGMTGMQNCSLAWGDYDNDGDLDVAAAGYNPSFAAQSRIYVNLGSGFFFDTGAGLTPVIDAALAWVDYDGDGDLDLLLTGNSGAGAVTKLYRNDTIFGNSVPTPPWGLSSLVSGKTVTLNWNGGSDANQPGGFTYNLRVGTAPGADNVVASMADAATGFRRVPRLGNMSQRLSWSLKLPVGNYYWSAQTLDHVFAGSAFDTEQYFEIPPQPPDVTTLPATNITSSSVTLRGMANPNGDLTSFNFEYGTTTNYGSATTPFDIGNGVTNQNVSDVLTDLLPATTYHFRAVAVNNYGVSYGTNRSFVTPIFVEVANTNFIGVGAGSIAWGDYNNDGYLDLLVAGGNSTGVVTRVYRNLSGTNFVAAITNLAGINNGTVAWGDYDNDGDLDVLLTGNNTSRIYRNDGNDAFTDLNAGLPNLSTGASATWADFDNDGDLDFVLTGGGSSTVQLYRNEGNDQFAGVTNSLPPVNDSALSWADYDNDGDNDLLMTGYNFGVGGVSEMTRIYRSDGRGNFTNSSLSFQNLYRSATSWGDYDNDGDLDLLLCGAQFSTRYSMLYSNRNNGTFASVTISSVARVDQGNISWGDYDNDGDLDILLVGQASTGAVARVYRNDITTFRDSGAVLPALGNVRAEWGDYDNDGRLDILMTGYTGSNYVTKLFRNISPAANTPPAAPKSLVTTVANNAAMLSWAAATDASQSGGLTYNVRIGTAPGLSDVFNPMANESTGFRRLPKLGNANLRVNATITNLLVGNYYWSVQAVDHAYAGSAFSTNGSFTITAALLPPIAITKAATNVTMTSATLEGLANAKGAPTVAWFQHGTTTNFGVTTPGQNIGNGTTNVPMTAFLTNLTSGTAYYLRAVASNVNGTVSGATLSFTTGFQFSNVVTALPAIGMGSYYWSGFTSWGDYDNDGDLDVAITGIGLTGAAVYRNDGNDVFTPTVTNLPTATFGVIEWGDYDNDGRLDLLIGGSPELAVLHNEGNGSFTTNFLSAINFYGPVHATWVDYDNDGDLDFSYVGDSPTYSSARLFRNDAGTFVESGASLPILTRGWMAWGDYDRDGDPDLALTGQIIITNYIHPSIRIYRNDGGGNFTDLNASLARLEDSRVNWGDFDGDGDLDLLCGGYNPSGYQTILYRNDTGAFVEMTSGLPGSHGLRAAADYDNDGDLDVVLQFVGASTTTNAIFRNIGNGTFTNTGISLPDRVTAVMWADYDKDGDLDALAGSKLLRNNHALPNALATAPTGLSFTRTGNVVRLAWQPATDPNQPTGLSYNLAIGTSPGNYNVLSPAAGADGFRRLARPGVAAATNWLLTLPVGNYYWRVQAIDHTLAGSPLSGESSFTVPLQPPWAETLAGTTNGDGYAVFNGLVNPNGLATTVYFDYGSTTNFGSRTPAQSVGSGTAWLPASAGPGPLPPEGYYFYRLAASNSLGLSLGATHAVWQPWFTDRTPPYGYTYSASWADADNDGDMDLTAQVYFGARIYRNEAGSLTNQVPNFNVITFGAVAWGDYDNDGDVDLFVNGRDGNFVGQAKLFRNDGNHVYTEQPVPISPGAWGTVNWTDLDGDGDLDLLVTGENAQWSSATQVCLNEGGSFTQHPTSLPGVSYSSVACVDYDNDGDVDVLLGGSSPTGGVCRLFANDGQAGFSDSGLALPQLREVSLAWGDVDNDNDLDILINGRDNTATNFITKIFMNNGGVFTDANVALPGVMGCSALFDYNNDGWLDIVLGGDTNQGNYILQIFRNLGGATFADSGIRLAPASSIQTGVFPADYDNDGDPDLLFVFGRLLRNEGLFTNAPPTTPAGLSSVVASNSAFLSWKAASDANQLGGLTYNVRVGTSPGGENILSSMSRPDGRRLVMEGGNAFARTNLALRNLNVGTYYWSVQSVDHAKAGSGFSTNNAFVIPAQKPSLTTLPHTNLTDTGVTLNGRVNPNGAATAAYFQYGLTTNYTQQTTALILGAGVNWLAITQNLAGLNYAATYYYRLVASNQFGIVFGPDRSFATPQFTEVNPGLPDVPGVFGPADYDNDGDLDFVFSVYSTSPTLLCRNEGGATFTTNSGVTFPGLNTATFDWGDFDRDGDLDLLLTGFNGGTHYTTRLYRNDGGTFTNLNVALPNVTGSARWGDFDNDGDLDVLISSWIDGYWQVYRNNGGQFSLFQGANGFGGFVVWADYDNDGDLDFLVSGSGGPFTQLFRNDGAAGFTNSGLALPNLRGQAAFGDYDNDGDLDLLLSGDESDFIGVAGQTLLYRNEGAGAFTQIPTSLPAAGRSPLWADFDNDGDLDIILTGQLGGNARAQAFRNEGNGIFSDINTGLMARSGDGLACGDFDRDGDLDFLISGYTESGSAYLARLYRNNQPQSNTPPTAPAGLTNTTMGGTATMSWNPASDANQAGGLSYNLRVGTTPGGGQIVSPDSAPDGLRRVARLGNVQADLRWSLTNLPVGTYYWSVQAVDHSYAGSPFAPEQSFVIDHRPVAYPQLVVLGEDTSRDITLSASDSTGQPLTYTISAPPTNGVLSGTPPGVNYRPKTNFFGADQFTFQAHNPLTNSLPAAVTLIVTQVHDVAFSTLAIQKPTNGQPQLTITGEPFERYQLEASSDLIHWVALTNVVSSNGIMAVIDVDAALYPRRFYRAALSLPPASVNSPQRLSGGFFQFNFAGELARRYEIQASINLTSWVSLTNVLLTTSPVTFTDPAATNFSRRFYRVRPLP